MTYELFKKKLREAIEYNIAAGQMDKETAIDYANYELSCIDNGVFNSQIQKYDEKKKEITSKYATELGTMVDQYYRELLKALS